MHELAICRDLVAAVLAELRRVDLPGVRVLNARVRVGAMRQIVPDTLRFAYKVLTENTPAAGSTLEIETEPVTVRCRVCGWSGPVEGGLFACRRCRTGDVEVTAGRDITLERLEIETDEPNDD